MALTDYKISSADLINKGVVGLPDKPNLSTADMQAKFDEIATDVIIPKYNDLVDELVNIDPAGKLPIDDPAFTGDMTGTGNITVGGDVTDGDGNKLSAKLDKDNPTGTGKIAIGSNVTNTGTGASAIGNYISSTGANSFGLNSHNSASGDNSIAGGNYSSASGINSMALGDHVNAKQANQFAVGKYNADNSDALFMVGNGTADQNRNNAFVVESDGDVVVGKALTVNGNLSMSAYNITALNVSANAQGNVSGAGTSLRELKQDKADKSTTYTKAETDNLLSAKADADKPIESSLRLVTTTPTTEKVPYNLRSSGGKVGAVIENTEKIVGGTIAWNQLVQNGNFASTSNWANPAQYYSFTVSDNIGSFEKIQSGGYPGVYTNIASVPAGHKLLFSAEMKGSKTITGQVVACFFSNEGTTKTPIINVTYNTSWTKVCKIVSFADSVNRLTIAYSDSNTNWDIGDKMYYKNVFVIDLTQMLGTSIADYVATLESGTAGAGVAWLKAHGFLTNDYYAYNTGTLMSVNTSAHTMRNANDEVICDVALDSSLTLKGIYKLDANNDIYCDGDTYESDGTVTRNYDSIDLGSLTWVYASSQQRFYAENLDISISNRTDFICAKYVTQNLSGGWETLENGCIARHPSLTNNISIKDTSYTDATQFKNSLSGVYLYFKTTPTTETATGFTNPQIVDANGTEEYVDYAYSQSTRDVKVPVGHESQYTQAMDLPAIPSGDGAYALTATNSGGIVSFSWESANGNRSLAMSQPGIVIPGGFQTSLTDGDEEPVVER